MENGSVFAAVYLRKVVRRAAHTHLTGTPSHRGLIRNGRKVGNPFRSETVLRYEAEP